MNVSGTTAQGKDYESEPLYVSFPAGTLVHHAWVERARTHGENLFSYDKQEMAPCFVPDFADGEIHASLALPTPLPKAALTPTIAQPTSARFDLKCDKPFIEAQVSDIPDLDQPAEPSGPIHAVTVSIVALSRAGRVLDAWTVGSSGNLQYDMAIAAALKGAKYRAPVSYCVHADTLLYIVEGF